MWKCGTIMILFAYCTCVPPSLLLSVLHELYSASRRSHRGAGGMTAGFRAPSVPVPLPIPMEMLYFLYLCKNWELSGVAQQCCLLRHQNYSIHDKWGALWLCRTSLKLAADDAVALLTQTIHPSAMQRWVGKLRAGVEHHWWQCCDSGFGPQLHPTKLSFTHGSSSTINSCFRPSRSLCALFIEWFCFPLSLHRSLLTDVGCCNVLFGIRQIFKSLFLCREKMPITRGSHVNSADDRNHLLFVTLFAYIWSFVGKGLSLYMHLDATSLVFLLWMLFCSHLNNHLCFLSKRALYGGMGAVRGEGWQCRKHKVTGAPFL